MPKLVHGLSINTKHIYPLWVVYTKTKVVNTDNGKHGQVKSYVPSLFGINCNSWMFLVNTNLMPQRPALLWAPPIAIGHLLAEIRSYIAVFFFVKRMGFGGLVVWQFWADSSCMSVLKGFSHQSYTAHLQSLLVRRGFFIYIYIYMLNDSTDDTRGPSILRKDRRPLDEGWWRLWQQSKCQNYISCITSQPTKQFDNKMAL